MVVQHSYQILLNYTHNGLNFWTSVNIEQAIFLITEHFGGPGKVVSQLLHDCVSVLLRLCNWNVTF